MSVIYIDGFDNLATADLAAKGWSTVQGSPTISTTHARTGAQALLTNSGGVQVQRAFTSAQEHDTITLGAAVYFTSFSGATDLFMSFRSDAGATSHVEIYNSSGGGLQIKNGNGTVLGSISGALLANAFQYLEVKVKLSDTVGTVQIWINGTSVFSITGADTKNGGTKTVFDSLRFGPTGGGFQIYWDDLYITNGAGSANTAQLGDCKVQTVLPNGNGTTSQLLGSDADSVNNFALVNAALPQTTTYVGSSTTDQEDTYAFADATGTVIAAQVSAYSTKTDAGARSLAIVTRTGGADHVDVDQGLPFGSQTFIRQLMENDPATAVAWTLSGFNAAEFGARVRP